MNKYNSKQRFLLVSIVPQQLTQEQALIDLKELLFLVETFGGDVRDVVIQNREVHDKGMYIGRGKIEEVSELIKTENIDVVVLNAVIKPGQIYGFQAIFEKLNHQIQVWDRIDLILKIFSKNANTAEAKLQIELAAMRHMGPRIYGMGEEMSRQGGGIGTVGIGETNTELMKRHWQTHIKKVKLRLEKLNLIRKEQLDKRRQLELPTVSLVGYTNAGKTSLFNKLCNKKNYVKNALFATLDSSVGTLFLADLNKEILVSDTIGFIKDLPPQLVEAFKSTLMQSVYADVLIQVIDASDEDMDRKINVVNHILFDLKLKNKPMIYVFNKYDLVSHEQRSLIKKYQTSHQALFVSTKSGTGIEELKQLLSQQLQVS